MSLCRRSVKRKPWYKELKEKGAYCHYCGMWVQGESLTIDHRTPIIKGGTAHRDNIVPCCKHCNEAKGDLTAEQYISLLCGNGGF